MPITHAAYMVLFLLVATPLCMIGMNEPTDSIAAPLCVPDETIWHATFADQAPHEKPTILLSTKVTFDIKDIQHINAHLHLRGEQSVIEKPKAPTNAELMRICRKGTHISNTSNEQYLRTLSHELTHSYGHATLKDRLIIKRVNQQESLSVTLEESNITENDVPWCAANVGPESPVVITTYKFAEDKDIYCWDPISDHIICLNMSCIKTEPDSRLEILTVHASCNNEQTAKLALATTKHAYVKGTKITDYYVSLIDIIRGNSGELMLHLLKTPPITLDKNESLDGLGWTTDGRKLVLMRRLIKKPTKKQSRPHITLETYNPTDSTLIARTSIPMSSALHLVFPTELSNDYSLLINGNTLATTPRSFVRDNALHDVQQSLPPRDVQRASKNSMVTLLQRELTGSRIAFHRGAAQKAINR